MSLDSPGWLVVGILVVVALVVGAVVATRRRRAALKAAGLMAASGRRVPLGLGLTLAALAVLAVAVAGPAASVPVTRAAGTVILAMDVSNSMAATDVAPTRLGAAKTVATNFIAAQPSSVDIGVVAFENGGLTTDQPSADHAAATTAVQRLAVSGGTSLADAILTSLSAITGKTIAVGKDGTVPSIGYWGSATIVLISDGEDLSGGSDVETAADAAEAAGVHVETVGVGTTTGTTVAVDGYHVHTALDADTLTSIAQTTDGSYHPASDATEINGIAKTIKLRLTTHHESLPLAGAFTLASLVLLVVGASLTVLRTGRLV